MDGKDGGTLHDTELNDISTGGGGRGGGGS